MKRRGIVVVAVAVLAAGCTDPAGTASGEPELKERDPAVVEVIADLNKYWQEADSDIAVGFEYTPVPPERITVGDEGVMCDGQELRAAEVEGNAFVANCPEGVTVAYDPDYVSASQARLEATFSHEWGHVLQMQGGDEVDLSTDPAGLPIDAELQADCLAGAWSAERGKADFDALIADVEDTGDPPGVAVHDPEAHGSTEQRRAAYELGLDNGPHACIEKLMETLPTGN